MAKFKVKNTTIYHNGKAYGDGKTIELSEQEANKLAKYLTPVKDKNAQSQDNSQQKNNSPTPPAPPTSQTTQNNGGNNGK